MTSEELTWAPTLPSHSHLETFLQTTVLALVPMMLVNRTVPIAPALIGQISSDAAFEERLASFARKLSVMFATGFVSTDHTFYMLLSSTVFFWTGRRDSLRRPAGQVGPIAPRRYGQCRHATHTWNTHGVMTHYDATTLVYSFPKSTPSKICPTSPKCVPFTLPRWACGGIFSLRALNYRTQPAMLFNPGSRPRALLHPERNGAFKQEHTDQAKTCTQPSRFLADDGLKRGISDEKEGGEGGVAEHVTWLVRGGGWSKCWGIERALLDLRFAPVDRFLRSAQKGRTKPDIMLMPVWFRVFTTWRFTGRSLYLLLDKFRHSELK